MPSWLRGCSDRVAQEINEYKTSDFGLRLGYIKTQSVCVYFSVFYAHSGDFTLKLYTLEGLEKWMRRGCVTCTEAEVSKCSYVLHHQVPAFH